MKIWVVTRDTYYDENDLVTVHESEDGAMNKASALNQQWCREGVEHFRRHVEFFHPGAFRVFEKEVLP